MSVLIVGLLLFLGVHSLAALAPAWRRERLVRWGMGPWKGLYALASLAGFAVMVWGFGLARLAPIEIWTPAPWLRWATVVLTLPAFILFVAAYVPRNAIKAGLGHPMLLGTKVWAFAHLLSNGRLADIVLFGAFLVWAAFDFRSARRRDRAEGVVRPPGTAAGTALAVVIGVAAWGLFGSLLHAWLIGVRPLG